MSANEVQRILHATSRVIIGISRGVSVIMSSTGLDVQVLKNASSALSGMSPILFTNVTFLIYIALSFLIPSTSGLASVSIPIFGALAYKQATLGCWLHRLTTEILGGTKVFARANRTRNYLSLLFVGSFQEG